MMAFRRIMTRVALQHTATIVKNRKELVAKSSTLSTIKMISMNWVNTKKYNKHSVRIVKMPYNTLASFEHHSIGRHIPATVYIKKLNESICIFINSSNALNRISYIYQIRKISAINIKCDKYNFSLNIVSHVSSI